jgi:antitoxin component YwqK of YwqJK toxin-antitoxin module
MRLLTILCLVLLVSCSQEPEVFTGTFIVRDGITYHQDTNEPVTGIVEEFHDNGQLRERGNFIDGEPEGLREWFHDNGQLQQRINFIDGKQEGLLEVFHANGQLEFKGNLKDDKLDGLLETFDRSGNLTKTDTYRNGELVEENDNP